MLNEGERHLFEYLHQMSGGFMHGLIDTMMHADQFNLARLKMGFPEEAEAVRRYKNEDNYHIYIEENYLKDRNNPLNVVGDTL